MATESDHRWARVAAQGVTIVLVAGVAEVIVANLAGFLVPMVAPRYHNDAQDSIAAMRSGMAWVGTIQVVFIVPLIIGVWKVTSKGATVAGKWASRLRNGIRFGGVAYGLVVTSRLVGSFFVERADLAEIAWVSSALWWGVVLSGLEYARRLFVGLGEERLAFQSRVVAIAYLALVPVADVFAVVMMALHGEAMSPETADGTIAWGTAGLVVLGSVFALVAAILLGGILLKLRQVLLSHANSSG